MKIEKKYEEIINMEHHISKKHKPMSIEARSAQFAPYATLKGYGDEIKETSKKIEEKYEKNKYLK